MSRDLNLLLAALWSAVGIGILLWPAASPANPIGIDSGRRVWLGGFTILLAGFNLVRWRLARLRRRADEEARALRTPIRPRREEPPNPDFDFSNPRPENEDPDQPGRPPGSG